MSRTIFTREVADKVIELVSLGHTHRSVAEACGVCRHTLYNWRRMGEREDADELHKDFAERFIRATGEGILAIEKVVLAQACEQGEGELGLKVLGRRRWREWGQQGYKVRQIEKDIAAMRKELQELRSERGAEKRNSASAG